MSKVFIIKNQDNHYLDKHDEWVDGSEAAQVFRSPHRDIALNKLIDQNIRDVSIRGELIQCELDSHNQPRVNVINPIATTESPPLQTESCDAS
jgi:hypothetical protein